MVYVCGLSDLSVPSYFVASLCMVNTMSVMDGVSATDCMGVTGEIGLLDITVVSNVLDCNSAVDTLGHIGFTTVVDCISVVSILALIMELEIREIAHSVPVHYCVMKLYWRSSAKHIPITLNS